MAGNLNPGDLATWLTWLGPEIRPAVITAVGTVVAATIGAMMVVRQIGAQGRNAIAQTKHAEALKLKLDIYKQILAVCDKATLADTAVGSFVRKFESDVGFRMQKVIAGPPEARFSKYSDLINDCNSAAVELLSLTEKWRIVDPRIQIFQTAFGVAMDEIQNAGSNYTTASIVLMPFDNPLTPGVTYPWSPPDDARYSALQSASKKLLEALMLFGCFVGDFRVEMQNALLKDLFGEYVIRRAPLDPRYVVVSLDRHMELAAYFERDTLWGQRKRESEERARAQLARSEGTAIAS